MPKPHDPPDPPSEPPSDPSPATLARLQAILHEYQVPPEEAEKILNFAVMEVSYRDHPSLGARDARLVRSVERRALAYRKRLLRQRIAELDAEGNGHEPDAELDLEAGEPETGAPQTGAEDPE